MDTHLQNTTTVRRSLEARDSLNVTSPDKPSMNRTGDRTMTTHRYLGFLLIIVSALCFGAMPIFARFAYRAGTDPITVLFLRFTIAGGVMLLLMLVRRTAFPRGRALFYLALMGALGYVGESLTYFTALSMASAGLIALLLYLYPAIVTLLAVLFLKERLTFAKVGSLLLALTGIVLTLQLKGGGSTPGILLGVLAAVIYAVYILVGSRVVVGTGAIASSTIVMASTALVYAGIVSVHGATFPKTSSGWVAVLAIALVSTVLAFVTFFAGLKRIGPTNASTFSTLEPVVTVVFAALLLGEDLNPIQMLGGALMLVAVILLARSEAKKSRGTSVPIRLHRWVPHLHEAHNES